MLMYLLLILVDLNASLRLGGQDGMTFIFHVLASDRVGQLLMCSPNLVLITRQDQMMRRSGGLILTVCLTVCLFMRLHVFPHISSLCIPFGINNMRCLYLV